MQVRVVSSVDLGTMAGLLYATIVFVAFSTLRLLRLLHSVQRSPLTLASQANLLCPVAHLRNTACRVRTIRTAVSSRRRLLQLRRPRRLTLSPPPPSSPLHDSCCTTSPPRYPTSTSASPASVADSPHCRIDCTTASITAAIRHRPTKRAHSRVDRCCRTGCLPLFLMRRHRIPFSTVQCSAHLPDNCLQYACSNMSAAVRWRMESGRTTCSGRRHV